MTLRIARGIAAAVALPGAAAAQASQLSDLWWNPLESGWGMQLVQQDDTAFVTLFVYDSDGRPLWLVAPDAHVIAFRGVDGLPILAGPLYRASGPGEGATFDPALVTRTKVGELTLEPESTNRLRVVYDDGAVSVTKVLERQTWRAPLIAGFLLGAFDLRYAPAAGGPPFGRRRFAADTVVDIEQTVHGLTGFLVRRSATEEASGHFSATR